MQIADAKNTLNDMNSQISIGSDALDDIKQQIGEIEKRRNGLIAEVNSKIYPAKAEAEKIISDAEAKAQEIIGAADKVKTQADDYVARKTEAAESTFAEAKVMLVDYMAKLEQVNKDRTSFDAYKTKTEAEILSLQETIKKNLETLVGKQARLDILSGVLDRKQAESNALSAQLSEKVKVLDGREYNLNKQEEDLAKEWEVLSDEKHSTIDAVSKLNTEVDKVSKNKTEIDQKIAENSELLNDISVQREALSKQQEDIKAQLNVLAKTKTVIDEQEKSFNEKNRLLTLRFRQLDEKIAILKQLREEQK